MLYTITRSLGSIPYIFIAMPFYTFNKQNYSLNIKYQTLEKLDLPTKFKQAVKILFEDVKALRVAKNNDFTFNSGFDFLGGFEER